MNGWQILLRAGVKAQSRNLGLKQLGQIINNS